MRQAFLKSDDTVPLPLVSAIFAAISSAVPSDSQRISGMLRVCQLISIDMGKLMSDRDITICQNQAYLFYGDIADDQIVAAVR